MLKFECIRDGYNQIIGSKISGLAGGRRLDQLADVAAGSTSSVGASRLKVR